MKMIKSLLTTMMLSVSLLTSTLGVSAAEPGEVKLVSEVATLQDREQNLYELSVNVPGVDSDKYYEVIVMVDASGSQTSNLDELRETITDLGVDILRENGTIRLTLMHFGISGATLFSVGTPYELEQALNNLTSDELERWPTATNCEGSFTHIIEHIENSDKIEKAFVVYISDGETNMSDEPRVWMDYKEHDEWHYSKWTTQKVVEATFKEEIARIKNGEEPSSATKEYFKELVEASSDATEIATKLGTVTLDEKIAWMDLAFRHAYDKAGLDYNGAYPVSKIEQAFIDAHGMESSCHFGFAYVCLGASSLDAHSYNWDTNTSASSYLSPTKGQKAAAKANELAELDVVKEIYMIGMAGNGASGKSVLTSWMNPSDENIANGTAKVFANSEKMSFADGTTDTTEVNGVMEEIKGFGDTLSVTPYNDLSLVSYTSKWMNMDPTSVKIYDGNTLICAYNEETEQYESVQPSLMRYGLRSATPLVAVDLVDSSEYSDGGSDVEGNTSGDIYRITWNVKDGALLLADDYKLTYNAVTDTNESGFTYNTDYASNGNTVVNYSNKEGNLEQTKVAIPNIDADDGTDDDISSGSVTITTNQTQDINVKAEVNSSFEVVLPKEVNLSKADGSKGSGLYEADIPVSVKADIGTNETIKVSLVNNSVNINTANNESILMNIGTGKTEFTFDDLKNNTEANTLHHISVELTPGEWQGTVQFDIELTD